ncbi:DUF1801 domain-containing protein [Antarcticibacterium sp. 1MA-6-2]|uniref:iron chaperone n=1 Tax=Antarcticibacterium sp. 1MA-6-2 TaxID=2908210 RepID=UPI001F1B07F8|nr:DUF1801 domain-containing protein [Antarcticibacterium sp. 1MA-6-2]UJH92796.1 DUF1801 domain-containing protein [Antarcticibacterium sp. 1MA-6-2]
MSTVDQKPENIDDYIGTFHENVQQLLQQVREAILKAAPQAQEVISYAIPTYVLAGNLVHFAAFKNHIGFYPGPSAIAEFRQELTKYKGAKGSVQFPLKEPIPFETISKIVKFRVEENLARAKAKSVKK